MTFAGKRETQTFHMKPPLNFRRLSCFVSAAFNELQLISSMADRSTALFFCVTQRLLSEQQSQAANEQNKGSSQEKMLQFVLNLAILSEPVETCGWFTACATQGPLGVSPMPPVDLCVCDAVQPWIFADVNGVL